MGRRLVLRVRPRASTITDQGIEVIGRSRICLEALIRPILPFILLLASLIGVRSPVGAAGGASILPIGPGDVTTYLYGIDHTGFNATETTITPLNARHLHKQLYPAFGRNNSRAYGTPAYAATVISAQPLVVGNLLLWGTWDGTMHAADRESGRPIWTAQIGHVYKDGCDPAALGVASTGTITTVTVHGVPTTALIVGGGDGALYALSVANGAVLWRTPLGSTRQGYFLWASPAIYHSAVYMGVASIGDCPAIHGQVVKLNADTGAVQQVFHTVSAGCAGGSVWGSVTIDALGGALYVTTGNPSLCVAARTRETPYEYAPALLKLRLSDLHLLGSWIIPEQQQVADSDFGATPTLFTARIHGVSRPMVGAINKNGIFYAFDRNAMEAGPVWQTPPLANSRDSLAPAAWDGKRLYVAAYATVINGIACRGNFGSLRALDPATGAFLWQDCLFGGPAFAAVTAAPGLVIAAIGSHLYLLDPATGHEFFSYQKSDFNWYYAPPIIAHGVLYAANSDGTIESFAVPTGSAP